MEDEELNSLKAQLKEAGYENKSITYLEFQYLKQKYAPNWEELKFGLFLGITQNNFHNFKYKKDYKVIILKNPLAIEEDREYILKQLKKEGYVAKFINYEEFKQLYLRFGKNLPERKFAVFLGLTPSNFASMKARGGTAKILKDEQYQQEIENKIKSQILEAGLGNKKITYEEFLKLHEKYGHKLSEIQFAKALGISSADYWCVKHIKIKITVLKTNITQMKPEEIEDRVKQIREKNSKLINYEQFKEYYGKYGKNLNELQFAQILGIKADNYYAMKSKKYRARIDFDAKKREETRHTLSEARFYDETELKEIAAAKGITLEKLLTYAFNLNEDSDIIEDYIYMLQIRKKLFIGHTIMPKDFLKNNGEELLKLAQTQSRIYGRMFRLMRYSEDVASEVLLILMEKYGEIVYNFEREKAILLLTKIAKVTAKYKYYKKFSYRRANFIRCPS